MATDVDLNWVDTSGNEDGFRIYRNQTGAPFDPGDLLIELPTPDLETYTDPAVADGTWHYAVRAYNTAGESTDVGTNIESITLPVPTTIIEDDFNVADRVLQGHTPTITDNGNTWVEQLGQTNIVGNRARFTGSGSGNQTVVATIDAGTHVCKVSAVHETVVGLESLSVRWESDSNYFTARLQSGEVRIYEFDGGWNNRGSAAVAPRAGADFSFTSNADDSFEATYDGVTATTGVLTTTNQSNNVGISGTSSTGAEFDNFKVEPV